MEVVFVLTQVVCKMGDAPGKQCDLHLCRTDVALVGLELSDRFFFRLFGYGHSVSPTKLQNRCAVIGV
jgi:hypothetical protein